MPRLSAQFALCLTCCVLGLAALLFAPRAHAMDIRAVEAGGLSAWLAQDESALVHLELHWRDIKPSAPAGLTHIMMELLQDGTDTMDAIEFRQQLAALGAQWHSRVTPNGGSIYLIMLAQNKQSVWALLRAALQSPRFAKADIARIKQQTLGIQQQMAQSPPDLAQSLWPRASFAPSTYSQPVFGTPNSIASITRRQLRALHAQWLTQSNLIVSAAGALTEAELNGWLEDLADILPQGDAGAATPPTPPWHRGGRMIQIRTPGPQTELIFGQSAPAYGSEAYYALRVLQVILGGGFRSRLMQSLREERGWAYGVGLRYHQQGGIDFWSGMLASENARIDDAYALIKDTLRDVIANGVTPDELSHAKSQIRGALVVHLRTGPDIVRAMRRAQRYGLTRDFIAKQRQRIAQIRLADVQAVAAQYMQPDKLFAIAVGNSNELLPQR